MILIYWYLLVLVQSLVLPPEWPNIVKPTLFSLRESKLKLFTSLQSLMISNSNSNMSISTLPKFFDTGLNSKDNDNTTLLFIPRELINPTMFQTLGLQNLMPHINDDSSSYFSGKSSQKWVNLTSTDQLLIPDIFKTFFIFNTTTPSLMNPLFKNYHKHNHENQYHQINDLNKILTKSIPFDMPNLLTLIDYYMVVPEVSIYGDNIKNITTNIYHKSVLRLPSEYLPIFRNQLSEKKPMIVFMFNETTPDKKSHINSSSVNSNSNSPIISIKNYLSNTSISSFFDKFANIWLKQVNYESLVHAVYCNVNPNNQQGSYCLKIQNQMIHILPAFKKIIQHNNKEDDDLSTHSKTDDNQTDSEFVNQTDSDFVNKIENPFKSQSSDIKDYEVINEEEEENNNKNIIQSQALRQIHDKLRFKKEKTKHSSQDFIHDPKASIEKIDEKFDKSIDDKMTKLMNKKDSIKDSLDFKKAKFMNSMEMKLDNFDDKTDLFADSMKRKKNEMFSYKFNPRLFQKLQIDQGDDDDQEDENENVNKFDDIGIDENYEDELKKSSIYVNDGNEYINKRNQFYESINTEISSSSSATLYPNEDEIILPLELINFNNKEIKLPRKKSYSQIIDLNTGKPLKKRLVQFLANENDKNCQPITWYNIFHYSIFGEPKFCKDEYATK